ncbi:MAG: hypothetical protein WCJ35_23090 [Planctomycetota bacterium]
MANPARSLSGLVSWLRVLPALGIQVPTGILPATTACPLCHGDGLQVVSDEVLGGQWCCCRDCKFAGDLIELMAQIWNLTIPATFVRLDELDLLDEQVSPESIDGYVQSHVQYRRRMNQFWELAQQQIKFSKSVVLWELLKRIGCRDQVFWPEWAGLMGRFVGSAHYKQVQDLFHPGSYSRQARVNHGQKTSVRRGAGPGEYRMFCSGAEWEDVLVVPFFRPVRLILGMPITTEENTGLLYSTRFSVTSAGPTAKTRNHKLPNELRF